MLSRIALATFALTAPILSSACTDQVEDELDTDDASEGPAGKADIGTGMYTYYFVQPDLRRCAAPACGGVFYRLANAVSTSCLDGTKGDSCYAASADWSRLGISDAGIAKMNEALAKNTASALLVRANVGNKDWGKGLGTFGELRASEVWIAQTENEAVGPLAKIEDSGVRCIAAPCNAYREKKLNSSITVAIAELGWDKSGATGDQISDALDKMHGPGLIVSGYRYSVSGAAGTAKARSVTQMWIRATDETAN